MSKAILVLPEMPESCEKCQFYMPEYEDAVCIAEDRSIPYSSYRQDFCPLRPMPEDKHGYTGANDAYEEGYGFGFNACLRAIEGSGEDAKSC